MTRKDFEFIATTIREYPSYSKSLRAFRLSMARHFAFHLSQTHPRFDRRRFLVACIGACATIGEQDNEPTEGDHRIT